MIRLSEQARAADSRPRDHRAGRLSVPALLGIAVLVAASVPAVAASHSGGGGHSGGGHSSGGHSSGGHSGGGMHSVSAVVGGHGSGGYHGGPSGYRGAPGGGGAYHGGHYDGRGFRGGYPGWGFRGGFHGFYPRFYGTFGLGFTWGTPFFWGFPYDYWPYYGYGWGGWDGYYAPYSSYGYDRARRDEQGALDLDLSPADTQVYLDGQYVGTVDDFDGWPQYLWLDPGTYDLVFFRDGYKTLARQVTIYRGLVIDWTDRMEKGPSIRPEDLQTKTHDRRDARLRQDREMQDRADLYDRDRDAYDRGRDGDRGGYDGDHRRDGDWRDRADRDRDPRRHDADGDRDDADRDRAPADGRHQGRLRLEVTPDDASVYLDGRFVGTAEEVAQGGGLTVGAGDHTLSIVRPGRHSEERHFHAKSGEDTTLSIDLHNE